MRSTTPSRRVKIPTVEIHISNVREREPWRRTSVTEPACAYQIFGRGVTGYLDAISHLHYRRLIRLSPCRTDRTPTRWPICGSRCFRPHPVAVLVHGGGWTDPYTRDLMDGAAVDLTGRGTATWNIEYRRIPPVGGWRDSIADVAAAVDSLSLHLRRHCLDLDRVTVIGHSAGAQLGSSPPRRLPYGRSASSRWQGSSTWGTAVPVSTNSSRPSWVTTSTLTSRWSTPSAPFQAGSRPWRCTAAWTDPCRRIRAAGSSRQPWRPVIDPAWSSLGEADHMDVISPLATGWEEVARACLGG